MAFSRAGGRVIQLGAKAVRIWRVAGCKTLLSRTWKKFARQVGMSSSDRLSHRQYRDWIAENEPGPEELVRQEVEAERFHYQPLVSIITPVFNPPDQALRDTIESVLKQTYRKWELCLVDGNSSRKPVREILAAYSRLDNRVRVKELERNLGISGNTNEGLALSQGEFVAFLDHDDVLSRNMLFEVIHRLNERPATDLIYFDEDLLSANGERRHGPFFKPEWSPELLLSANYLTHVVLRKSLADSVGWLDPETDGAQDWDFMFRCMERTTRIEHIPKVLYHWRQVPRSCSRGDYVVKPYAREAQVKAVAGHLRRMGIQGAKVSHLDTGKIRAIWPTQGKKVSIIIPTKDRVNFLEKCLSSILKKTTYHNFEIVVVDNGSREKATHQYYDKLQGDGRIRIIDYTAPFNYSRANNLGAGAAAGEFFLFLNNDTQVLTPDWLEEMVRWAELPEVGAVGTKLLYPNDTIQHAGIVLGLDGIAGHVFAGAVSDHLDLFGSVDWYRNYSAVTGACLMISRGVYTRVCGFDEAYQLGYSDVEICLRVQDQGYRVVYTPFAPVRHYEGKTRSNYAPLMDYYRGYAHVRGRVEAGDPYFNPNLSYASAMPKVANRTEETRLARLQRMLREQGPIPTQGTKSA
jgi:GT2 family glycosyltransferase